MKKITKALFAVLMTVTLLFATACEFSFNIDFSNLSNIFSNGCAGSGSQSELPTPAPLPSDDYDAGVTEESLSLTFEKNTHKYFVEAFLQLTFICNDIPDNIKVYVNNKVIEVDIDGVALTEDGKYAFTVEEFVGYIGHINKGSYEVKVIGAFGDKTAMIYDGAVEFDDEYFVAECSDGKVYYDKESCWAGPF